MGFLEPLAFVFTALYGVLVLFHLWERFRRRIVVPSLLLWAALREDTIRARRFRPDLLFWLQLLLLSCLIVGLARPYWRGDAGDKDSMRHIFVLDTTASMQAMEGRSSRFEQARTQALSMLERLPDDDEVMLLAAGHSPDVLRPFTRDRTTVAQALEQAEAIDAGGDLALAVALADSLRQRDDLPTDLDVFTDIPRRQLPAALRDRVAVFQVGESDNNLAIEALQVFQSRFQDYRGVRAQVLVQNFSHQEGHGFLTVQLEDTVVHRSGFTIPPRETRGFLVHDFPGPGRVTAHLDVADALTADNTAFGWIRPVTPVRVLLVSAPSPLVQDLRDLAAATPGVQLEVIEPAAFTPARASQAGLIIFHRFVPPEPPATNALYVYPPADNPLFPALGDATNIEVLDWNASHAVLQSLRPLAALPLQRARIVAPPEATQVLLWSRTAEREFPLALAGERDGHRFACLTFDLEAERLLSSDNLNVFLFFMNLLAWLTPESHDVVVMHTGDVQSVGDLPSDPLRVRDPRGAVAMLSRARPMVEPLFGGEYRISSDGTGRTLLANFFDPVESDIGRARNEPPDTTAVETRPQPPPATNRRRDTAIPGGREYGAWLYAAAAALLLLEWLAARRPSA